MRGAKPEDANLGLAAVYLAKAMREPGCPLCRRVREAEERWVWNVLYELTGDPEVHERFAASFGFCRDHTVLLAQVVETRELVTPTGVARLYTSAVVQALAALAALPGRRKTLPREACPLCTVAQEVADRESWFLGRLLGDPELWEAYVASDGLCLPHFLSVWAQAPKKVRSVFLADFRRRLAGLHERLGELQRKERFDVDELPRPEEIASWREALWRLSGMSYEEPLIKRG